MKEITHEDYLNFIRKKREITIENVKVKLSEKKNIKNLQPKNFRVETTTVWSFEKRGNWATHKGNYRGNWAPEVPRNLILRYTKPGETVLDQMVGSGTTLVECKLLDRNGIGVDINFEALMVTRDRLNFNLSRKKTRSWQKTYLGDARNLNLIENESVDLIATHPPYVNIIPYSHEKIGGDLSKVYSVEEYINEIKKVAKESFRVLKPGKHCGILVGDTRKHRHYVPVAFRVMQAFLEAGFILKEDIIKVQWHMKTTREVWEKRKHKEDFLLIKHEHLFVFRKPLNGEPTKFKESIKWW
ncbi:DNA methylase [Candidatus Bathyarchaeota archaeon]|nr:MAG: DNA methylase [Candidatus Bathyarchaeota archaeon]